MLQQVDAYQLTEDDPAKQLLKFSEFKKEMELRVASFNRQPRRANVGVIKEINQRLLEKYNTLEALTVDEPNTESISDKEKAIPEKGIVEPMDTHTLPCSISLENLNAQGQVQFGVFSDVNVAANETVGNNSDTTVATHGDVQNDGQNQESGQPEKAQTDGETVQIVLLPSTANAPSQQVGMTIEQYVNILQNFICEQERELSLNKAALVNMLSATNPMVVQDRLPNGYKAAQLANYRRLIIELGKVNDLPNSPTAEDISLFRDSLIATMNSALALKLNFHVIQPFVLDRYVKALDVQSRAALDEAWKTVELNVINLRDFLFTQESTLRELWAKRNENAGARSNPFRTLATGLLKERTNDRSTTQNANEASAQKENMGPQSRTKEQFEKIDVNSKGDVTNGEERLPFCLHPKCKSTGHRLFSCNRYLPLAICDREELLEKNEICRSCLQGYHPAIICKDTCDHCGVKHNSTLCYASEAKRARFQRR